MPTQQQFIASSDAFFQAFASNTPPLTLLSYFSTTHLFAPYGLNAIRSYFDLLATHWIRSDMRKHSIRAYPDTRQVVVTASVTWMWRQSRRSWTEDFKSPKIISFVVTTESSPGTCVMRAVDTEPATVDRPAMMQA
ncbi:hypothetical protein BD779DRAFT_1609071 [Infundibulicybe gibba]|nr:hypothetical protein BD779DRAFT_1609071 [Infundibulicybe gibba]